MTREDPGKTMKLPVAGAVLTVVVVGTVSIGSYLWLVSPDVWPPDFLWPREHIVAETTVDDHRFQIVQRLGMDFYLTEFRVQAAAGSTRSYVVDPDDGKIWSARFEVVPGKRTLFLYCGEERCGSYDWDTDIFRQVIGDTVQPRRSSTSLPKSN
jgi:hypothetical protein